MECAFGGQLSIEGFKKKSSSWYRHAAGVLQLVNLQRSSFGMQFYVNLCFVPDGMEVEGMPTPKEHKCPIRIRLTSAFPEQREMIETLFDLEGSNIGDAERLEKLARLTSELILPFLASARDLPSLRQTLTKGAFDKGLVEVAARRHLGVLNPSSPQ